MSRSYRKNAYIMDRNPSLKKIYNRRIRRSNKVPLDLPNGGKYKTLNESWDICDYGICYDSYEGFRYMNKELFDSDEKCYSYWKKNYKCK